MDILAIRGKTVSAVICQLQWRDCNWQKYQEGRTQVLKCPGGEGEGRRDLSGNKGERALLLVHANLIYRAYFGLDGYVPLIRLWISG